MGEQVKIQVRSVFLFSIRLICVLLLAWIGAIHLHLWVEGYREIPVVGVLFLANSVTAFLLAIALLISRRPLLGFLGAAFSLITLIFLLYSINFGIFGFEESSRASFVHLSIVIELVASSCLLFWAQISSSWR